MELFHASQQWATRPDDQRFKSLEELYSVTRAYADQAVERTVKWADLRVDPGDGSNLILIGKTGVPATLTHYAFGQLCWRVGAPAYYLRQLPATLAAQNINHGLKNRSGFEDAKLLFHTNGGYLLRAVTSKVYERVWNHEVASRLIDMSHRLNLIPGQQTFRWGARDEQVDPSDNSDKALYASDHDMFVFLMTPDRTILDPTGQPMRRGLIVRNSEVGESALWVMGFLFRDVCANHIIWGANGIVEIRLPHKGKIRENFWNAEVEIRRYLDGAESLDQAAFDRLRVRIADTKEDVLDQLFGIRRLNLSKKVLDASYDAVVPDEDGDPRTVWGMAQGITRYAQLTPYADERTTLDQAAGRLLQFQF